MDLASFQELSGIGWRGGFSGVRSQDLGQAWRVLLLFWKVISRWGGLSMRRSTRYSETPVRIRGSTARKRKRVVLVDAACGFIRKVGTWVLAQ